MTRKAVVLFAACWTLAMAGGRLAFGADIPEVNPLSGNEKAINEGKSWFRSVCSACHGGRAHTLPHLAHAIEPQLDAAHIHAFLVGQPFVESTGHG